MQPLKLPNSKLQVKLCLISPINCLETFAVASNHHLILAHIAKKSKEYRNFYQQMAARGDYIILDNGAYETGVPEDGSLIIDLAKEIGAKCIVLPDFPFQEADKTIKAAIDFLDKYEDGDGMEYMFVPTADPNNKGLSSFLDCWAWGAKVLGSTDWIGIAKNAGRNFLPSLGGAARMFLLLEVKKRGLLGSQKLHALGYNAIWEPYYLSTFGVRCLDCSSPVWRGMNNCSMYEYWKDIPVDFFSHLPITELRYEQVKKNISEFAFYAANKEITTL
jgi:hypothetical protein